MEEILHSHFICPQCGGTYFGSEQLSDGTLMRYCHGSGTGYPCGYSWHQSKDDEHLFVSYIYIKLNTGLYNGSK
jgi:hypothetical protein